jgi:hypothetical protein
MMPKSPYICKDCLNAEACSQEHPSWYCHSSALGCEQVKELPPWPPKIPLREMGIECGEQVEELSPWQNSKMPDVVVWPTGKAESTNDAPAPTAQPDPHAAFRAELDDCLSELAEILLEKNRQYGDSALTPVRILSRASAVEGLLTRIDDKLSRMQRGDGTNNADDELDALGYFALLRILRRREKGSK